MVAHEFGAQVSYQSLSIRATLARLEVIARRNPGNAPEIIAHIRKLERVARFVEGHATSVGVLECQSGSDEAL